MIVGSVAVIIKVTSIDPAEKHLEKTLTATSCAISLVHGTADTGQNSLYGSHICDEGEYGTLMLDYPLFKR